MDFLRLLSDDLQALRGETKKKYPVVREAVDKALATLPSLQQQYAALLRAEASSPPGPGHPLFKNDSVLRPFLLACNHTNASHKILILALVSIQRLVSWDAIEQSSVGSILRVLQIQAEKNTHVDVQVKLLQTLLQLVTLGFEEKSTTAVAAASTTSTTTAAAAATTREPDAENALVGNEDLVMQAIWICVHLHGGSSGASSVVGNTAAMTIRQVVSLAFGKVQKSPEAKRVGVLVFQELCFLSREENGVWLKRSTTSPMSVALGVELVETILSAHARLFRTDDECLAVLKQHVWSLIQTALETACLDAKSAGTTASTSSSTSSTSTSLASAALSSLSGGSNNSNNSSNSVGALFFPLLTFNCTMRHCREVELIQISLKSHHVLATIASRLRANIMANQEKTPPESAKRMDEIVLACLRALCAFSFPLPENTRSAGKSGNIGNGSSSSNGGMTSAQVDGGYQSDGEASHDEGDASVIVMITWREVHAMKAISIRDHRRVDRLKA
ncbi:hypothetical protein P43SY_006210 [Pythium insidiosum]|uniref:Mon2/Sec7/BIG1-like dimerisation and cyclophilin-binding domain-containing protein n=1 Tax=Pythium insidiosum TaxID=114742 RepID=A0AAD5LCE5_PYTIN|nr:hypothetical protein P43SY_006210 [Pythium insidiosum]